jgi:hypothetical protein
MEKTDIRIKFTRKVLRENLLAADEGKVRSEHHD